MNVLRVDRRSRGVGLALAAALAVLSLADAFAQTGPGGVSPDPSVTRQPAAPPAARPLAPRKLAPVLPERQAAGTTAGAAAPATPSGIVVNPLAAVDPDSVGLLSSAEGGFPTDMWNGTPYALVAPLFKEFPTAQSSATLRSLSKRLLASSARVPDGEHETGKFIAKRVELLAEMGDFEAATRLIEATPSQIENETLAWTEVNVRLLAGNDVRACAVVGGRIAKSETARWQKAFIFCQIAAGQKEQAGLALSLLRDSGESDPAFFQLAEAMVAGNVPNLESLPQPTPLTLAMLRVAKAKLPGDAMGTGQPGLLRAIAQNPSLDIEQRLDAAERAAANGALPLDALRDIYGKTAFDDRERAAPMKATESLSGPRARALLYQTAAKETIVTAKAETVSQAFKLAQAGGRFTLAARMFGPLIAAIPASSEHAWFAPQAARALLLSEAPQSAAPWIEVIRSAARFRPEDANAMTRLTPLVHIAGLADGEALEPALGQWWKATRKDENALDQATLAFTLLDSVGDRIPARVWGEILDGSPRDVANVPRAPLWFMFERAAAAGRLGEGVLAAIVSLGEGSVIEASPLVLHHVISGLKSLRFAKESRAIALEAAVEAGL